MPVGTRSIAVVSILAAGAALTLAWLATNERDDGSRDLGLRARLEETNAGRPESSPHDRDEPRVDSAIQPGDSKRELLAETTHETARPVLPPAPLDQMIALEYADDLDLEDLPPPISREDELHALLLDRQALGYVETDGERRFWRSQDISLSRLTPAYEEGRLVGLTVGSFPDGVNHALADAGLRPGDVISRVNDVDPERGDTNYWQLMEELVAADSLDLDVVDPSGVTRRYQLD